MQEINNISLIGMPGSGKSTTGYILAGLCGMNFIDTDDLIRERQQCSLQSIVDQQGYLYLREIESDIIGRLETANTVIATGGSAVYSAKAMQHLAAISLLVYLEAPFEIIEMRIQNLDTRGLARKPGQSLADLYHERTRLYQQWAQLTIDANRPPEVVAKDIVAHVNPRLCDLR